jgi:hypothetical protein
MTQSIGSPALPASRYYRHSGGFSGTLSTIALFLACAAAIVMSVVYSYLILYLPIGGYISFLITFGYAFATGWMSGRVLRWAKIRNNVVATIFGSIVGIAALYSAWVVWIYALYRRYDMELPIDALVDPRFLWECILLVNEHGAWSLGRSDEPVTGVFLWVVWLVEAGVVIGATVVFTRKAVARTPYCEQCNRWCGESPRIATVAHGPVEPLRSAIEQGDWATVVKMGPRGESSDKWYGMDLHGCAGCRQMYTLTVSDITLKAEKNGVAEVATILMDRLYITPAEADFLRTLHQSPAPAAAAAAEAETPAGP